MFLILSDSLLSRQAAYNLKYDQPILVKILKLYMELTWDGKEIVFISAIRGNSASDSAAKCEQVIFVYVLTAIPPWLTDSCNFITVLLVTQELEQTTLLFWSAACSITPHGLHTADRW